MQVLFCNHAEGLVGYDGPLYREPIVICNEKPGRYVSKESEYSPMRGSMGISVSAPVGRVHGGEQRYRCRSVAGDGRS